MKINILSSTQKKILSCLYFIEPFEQLLSETQLPKPILCDEIKTLLAHRLIAVFQFNQTLKDWQETTLFDSDNLDNYAFCITQAGLAKH